MRTVLVMKDVYGFSLADIAKQVGATEGAVKVRVFRARRRLAEELYGNDVIVPMRRKKTS
jgi:DNA-directed RNA polymerase specialized sigma24 family protein